MRNRILPPVDEDDLSPKTKRQVNDLQAFSEALVEEANGLQEENAHLKDEVAILKGEKKRPVFKPSRMHEEAGQADHEAPAEGRQAKRPGSHKKSKTVTVDRSRLHHRTDRTGTARLTLQRLSLSASTSSSSKHRIDHHTKDGVAVRAIHPYPERRVFAQFG